MTSLLDDTNFRRDLERVGLFGIILPFGLGGAPKIYGDGDVSWHIASGRWIMEHGRVPDTDPFSFTAAGRPWVPFEWLSDVIYASAFNLAGYAGLAAIVCVALAALNLVAVFEFRRWGSMIQVALGVCTMNLVLIPFLLARPHVLGWPLLALWTVMLLRAREQGRTPPLWAAALMILWTNLHASFALGLAVAAWFALEAVVAAKWDRQVIARWFVFGLLSGLAAMVTPNGIDGFLYPLHVSQLETLHLIQEWRPSSAAGTPVFFAILAAVTGALLWRGVRLPWLRALLLAGLMGMAFWQVRHQAVLGILAALILARPIAEAGGVSRSPAPPIVADHGLRRKLAAALVVAVLALGVGRAAYPTLPPETASNPRAALAAIPPDLRDQPVLNDYTFGGPLILAGIRPYIDGRSDMYGDEFFSEYNKVTDGDEAAFDRAVARWKVTWTMIEPSRKELLRTLDSRPEWKRIYADKVAVIHVRTTP